MGKILSHFHSMLGSLSLSVFAILLSACTVDHKAAEEKPEINTFSAYIEDNSIKHIVYNEDNTAVHTLATFSEAQEGYQLAIELNLDEDVQAYEFAVYVKGFPSNENKNEIHILNYEKTLNGSSRLMATVTGTICGIKPIYKPSSFAYFDKKMASDRALKHSPQIILQVAESDEDCLDEDLVYYEKLDFENYILSLDTDYLDSLDEDDRNTALRAENFFSRETISRYEANAVLIVNYESGITKSYGYLSNNPNAGLTFKYSHNDEEEFVWHTDQLTEELSIVQSAEREVLIYSPTSGEVRVISTPSLFTIGDIEENNSIDTPIQKQIDALFESPVTTIENPAPLTSTNSFPRTTRFTMLVNNELYFFNRNSVLDPPLIKLTSNQFSEANKTIVEHEIHASNNIVVITKDASSKYQGSTFNPETKAESSLMEGLESDDLDLIMQTSNMYINTLNLGDNTGWQAHSFEIKENNLNYETYEKNHRLVSFKNLQETESSLFLIGLDTTPNNHDESEFFETSGELLFKFSSTEKDGRFKATSNKTNLLADFSYGWFVDFNHDNFNIEGIVINDEFSRIISTTVSPDDSETITQTLYTFDPSKDDDIPDPSFSEQSLKLISTKTMQ